ncbi:MAG: DUF4340 domain-containing protein [Gammaproteobacteria bacterium]|jgi:hypothetical protein
MNTRNIIIALATALIVIAAWQTSREKAPTTKIQSESLYPGLVDQVNDVTDITIRSTQATTELSRKAGKWVVANRDNYPATFANVKNTLLNVANSTVVEKKTSKPEHYAQLGVADIDDANSKAVLVEIDAGPDQVLASLLVGNERSASQMNARQYYVRKADAAGALLVEGELNVSAQPQDWMNTDVVNVATERVRKVTITAGDDSAVVVSKEKPADNFFSLENVPNGFTAKSRSIISSLGAVLLDVKFENVAAASKVDDSEPVSTAEIRTFDGLVVNVSRYAIADEHFVRFEFDFDPAGVEQPEPAATDEATEADENDEPQDTAEGNEPSVEDEAVILNEKTAKWIYALPDYKNRMLEKRFDDMIKPVEEQPAGTAQPQ